MSVPLRFAEYAICSIVRWFERRGLWKGGVSIPGGKQLPYPFAFPGGESRRPAPPGRGAVTNVLEQVRVFRVRVFALLRSIFADIITVLLYRARY